MDNKFALRLALTYLLIAGLWIVLSDSLVALVVEDAANETTTVSMVKGLGFVFTTGYLLYALVRREMRRRHEIEHALRLREEQLMMVAGQMPLALWTVNRDLEIQTVMGQVAPLPHATMTDAYQQVIASKESLTFEFEEAESTYQVLVRPLYDTHNRFVGALAAALDVSQRKAHEARLQEILELLPVGIVIARREDGHILYANAAASQIVATPRDAMLGQSVTVFYADPTDRERLVADLQREGALQGREVQMLGAGGAPRWVLMSTHQITFNGEPAHLGAVIDIHDNKLAERALTESEERYRNLVNNAPIPILVHSGGKAVYVNPAAMEVLGGDRQEQFLGQNVWDFLHPDYHEMARERVRKVYRREGHVEPEEERFIRLDGEEVVVEVSATYVDYQGQPASQIVFYDITERKATEAALRRNEETARAFQKRLMDLHDVSMRLGQAPDVERLSYLVVELAIHRLGFERAALWLIDPDAPTVMRGGYGTGPDGQIVSEAHARYDFRNDPFIKATLNMRERAVMWEDHPLRHNLDVVGHGWNAMVSLWDGENAIGLIFVDNLLHGEPPAPFTLELLRLYGLTVGHALVQLRAQQALQQSETRYRTLVDNAPLGIGTSNGEGRILSLNQAMLDMIGYEPDQLEGIRLADTFVDLDERRQMLEELRATGVVHGFETRLKRGDGSVYHCRLSISTLEVDGQTINLTMAEDISEYKAAQAALQESEIRYRALFEHANDGIFLMEGPIFVDCNPAVLRLFGCERDEILNQSPYRFSPPTQPDGRASAAKALEKINAALAGNHQHFEWQHTRLDGTPFMAEITLNRIEFSGMTYLQAMVRDITDRLEAEEALRRSEMKFRSVVEQSQEGIHLIDSEGRVIEWNRGSEITTGISREAALGQYNWDVQYQILPEALRTPEKHEQLRRNTLEFLRTGVAGWQDSTAIRSLQRPDGTIRWVRSVIFPIYTDQGMLGCGMFHDLTDYREAQQALLESESRYRSLFVNMLNAFALCRVLTDDDGQAIDYVFEEVNDAFERLVGLRRGQVMGKTINELIPNRDNETFDWVEVFGDVALSGGAIKTEEYVATLDAWLQIVAYSPQPGYFVVIFDDITERKNMEVERLEREKLRVALEKEKELSELKSRFMSIVTHEFRTPLSVISTINGMLSDYYDRLSVADREEQYRRVQAQIERMDRMLDEVSMVNRVATGHLQFNPQPLDVTGFCQRRIDEAQMSLGPEHRLIFEPDVIETQEVLLDAQLLEHILNNLLQNAIKYSAPGTEVQLRLRRSEDTLWLEVRDQGIGILPEDQERLFEPYHRGKNVGQVRGSGLGLKIVKDCVDLHGGLIEVSSKPGVGSTFIVALPI